LFRCLYISVDRKLFDVLESSLKKSDPIKDCVCLRWCCRYDELRSILLNEEAILVDIDRRNRSLLIRVCVCFQSDWYRDINHTKYKNAWNSKMHQNILKVFRIWRELEISSNLVSEFFYLFVLSKVTAFWIFWVVFGLGTYSNNSSYQCLIVHRRGTALSTSPNFESFPVFQHWIYDRAEQKLMRKTQRHRIKI